MGKSMKLDFETQCAFETMINESIVARYTSDLDRVGEDTHGKICYRPLDTDHLINLLTKLWGEILTPEAINDTFDRLMEDQDEWPHGYCEENEEERPLSDLYPEA